MVCVHYLRDRDAAEAAVASITARGDTAFALAEDLAAPGAAGRLFEALGAELTARGLPRAIDVLINNAAVAPYRSLAETDDAAIDAILALNVRAPLALAREAAAYLRTGGRIVNVTSTIVRNANPNRIAYAVSKGALDAMTLQLAKASAPRSITVNAIAPGFLATDMNAEVLADPSRRAAILARTALGDFTSVDEIAEAVAYFCSPAAARVTAQILEVSGGFAL